ncbi:carbohydrate ABC transporter permease [Sutcliffiella cohnii]
MEIKPETGKFLQLNKKKFKFSNHSYLLMLLPAVLIYVVFIIYPLVNSVRMSFFDWNGVGPMENWVGIGNYMKFLTQEPFSTMFYRALVNSFTVIVVSLLANIIFGMVIAYILSKNIRFSNGYKTLFFLPYTLSVAVVAFLWGLMLNPQWGVVNYILENIGLESLALPWLGSSQTALPTIIIISLWHSLGFPIVLFYASIIGIPKELQEAAVVDGANGFTMFTRIVVPLLSPIMITVSVLTFIGALSMFELIFLLQGASAGPAYATDVLGTLFYRTAFGGTGSTATGMGLGAALATIMFLIMMPISLLAIWFQRKINVEF